MASEDIQQKYTPITRLADDELADYSQDLQPGWEIEDSTSLKKEFVFENYEDVTEFVHKVEEIAKQRNHHPKICFSFNIAEIKLTTNEAKGLTVADFDMAKEIDGAD